MLQVRKNRAQIERMLLKKRIETGKEGISPVLTNSQNNPHYSLATFLHIKINETKVKDLIDSGAELTLISKKLVEKLKLKIYSLETTTKLIAANKQ